MGFGSEVGEPVEQSGVLVQRLFSRTRTAIHLWNPGEGQDQLDGHVFGSSSVSCQLRSVGAICAASHITGLLVCRKRCRLSMRHGSQRRPSTRTAPGSATRRPPRWPGRTLHRGDHRDCHPWTSRRRSCSPCDGTADRPVWLRFRVQSGPAVPGSGRVRIARRSADRAGPAQVRPWSGQTIVPVSYRASPDRPNGRIDHFRYASGP